MPKFIVQVIEVERFELEVEADTEDQAKAEAVEMVCSADEDERSEWFVQCDNRYADSTVTA